MNRSLILGFFLILFSSLSAFAQITEQDTLQEVFPQPLDSQILSDTIVLLRDTVPYDWISYRMKLGVEMGEDKRGLQLFFVNKIDSILYLNLSLSAIELVRIVATPQEVTYVNKLSNEYYLGSFEFIGSITGVPLDFYMFQALFNGLDFKNFDKNFTLLDQESRIQLVSEQRCDTSKTPPLCINQALLFDNQYHLLQNKMQHILQPTSLLMNYGGYKETEYGDFFTTLDIVIQEAGIKISGEIRSLRFNSPGPTTIKIPNNFTPVDW